MRVITRTAWRISFAGVLPALAIACSTTASAGTEVYLARGGLDLLVLEESSGTLRVLRSPGGAFAKAYDVGPYGASALKHGSDLTVAYYQLSGPFSNPPNTWRDDGKTKFSLSQTVPGDYDRVDDTCMMESSNRPFHRTVADNAYLHRIDDSRIIDYHTLTQDTPATAAQSIAAPLLSISKALIAAHPNDLHVRVLYWDALNRNDLIDELSLDVAQWKPAISASPHRWLRVAAAMAEDEVASVRASRAGTNAADLFEQFNKGKVDLQSFLQLLPGALTQAEFRNRDGALIPDYTPNFLSVQVAVKVARVVGTLKLLQGEFEDARKLHLACYRTGQLLNAREILHVSLLGTAARSIAVGGLEIYALNAEIWPEELASLQNSLMQLENARPRKSGVSHAAALGVSMAPPDWEETTCRNLVVDTRLQLLMCAIAARHRLLTKNQLPMSSSEFAPLLRDALPPDPFTSAPLRIATSYKNPLTVYSVGPDKRSQQGTTIYDPTNGTVSAGDIIIKIPRSPRHPFPRKPVHASSRAHFLTKFPYGLPPDPFADIKGWGINITDTFPVKVFSFGPDTDLQDIMSRYEVPNSWFEDTPLINHPPSPGSGSSRYVCGPNGCMVPAEYKPIEKYDPQIQYDPTNGIVSKGDLFITLPSD